MLVCHQVVSVFMHDDLGECYRKSVNNVDFKKYL